MKARSSRPEVRNPVLMLPSMALLRDLDPTAKAALRAILLDIHADAGARAQLAWERHKAPMAAYWKGASVYAGHIARAIGQNDR